MSMVSRSHVCSAVSESISSPHRPPLPLFHTIFTLFLYHCKLHPPDTVHSRRSEYSDLNNRHHPCVFQIFGWRKSKAPQLHWGHNLYLKINQGGLVEWLKWWSTCLASMRLWIQAPVLLKKITQEFTLYKAPGMDIVYLAFRRWWVPTTNTAFPFSLQLL
jgi:hypothetical protein